MPREIKASRASFDLGILCCLCGQYFFGKSHDSIDKLTMLTLNIEVTSARPRCLGFWFILDQNLPRQLHPFRYQLVPLQRRQFRPVQVLADLDEAATRRRWYTSHGRHEPAPARISQRRGNDNLYGVTSPNGNLCTLRVPQGSQVSLDDVLAEIPNVVTREIDVLPAQRG